MEGLASRHYQLLTGHAITTPCLKNKLKKVDSDERWFYLSVKQQNREHLSWAGNTSGAELFREEKATPAILQFLRDTKVGQVVAEAPEEHFTILAAYATLITALKLKSLAIIAVAQRFGTDEVGAAALAQSLAREFTPRSKGFLPDKNRGESISPEGIAEVYWALHLQDRRALTWEVAARTSLEKW
ncbi:hypothetical protein FN846DRAFT_907931 [Sphaerosporella brunnea]|uniref:Uncharacterized protein n=1 Tax=Sphaerosporella brunnea TaxID=1250544 RepID=A0A5J5EVQ8_9PEZI|nr:hypothetical protein FN846DRAFT_907931 [Sphaerosporella brunnea]